MHIKGLEKCLIHSKHYRSGSCYHHHHHHHLLLLFLHQSVNVLKGAKTAECLSICKLHFCKTYFEKDYRGKRTLVQNQNQNFVKLRAVNFSLFRENKQQLGYPNTFQNGPQCRQAWGHRCALWVGLQESRPQPTTGKP